MAATPHTQTLRTISLQEGLDALAELRADAVFSSIDPAPLLDAATSLAGIAAELGARNCHDLAVRSAQVLQAITGVSRLDRVQPQDVADILHLHRNVLLTLLIATARTYGGPTNDICALVPRLHVRSGGSRATRLFHDDEIVLARTFALSTLDNDPRHHAALSYALVEAGMTPGETTHITTGDLVGYDGQVELIDARGNHTIRRRTLPADYFAKAVLTQARAASIRAGRTGNEPLVYSFKKNLPGTPAATASIQTNLNRWLTKIGLKHIDTTTNSIRAWRVRHAHSISTDLGYEISGFTPGRHDSRLAELIDLRPTFTQRIASKDTHDFDI